MDPEALSIRTVPYRGAGLQSYRQLEKAHTTPSLPLHATGIRALILYCRAPSGKPNQTKEANYLAADLIHLRGVSKQPP
jgi:hypothetical protein